MTFPKGLWQCYQPPLRSKLRGIDPKEIISRLLVGPKLFFIRLAHQERQTLLDVRGHIENSVD
jgi:hypothetical protein